MRNSRAVLVVLLCVAILLNGSGCATIISGNQQEIPISSTPSGAKVTADNGTTITTPGVITLSTKTQHTLVAEYPECGQQQQQLTKKLNNWIFLNILIDFGIITIPIDLITGAACELKPKEVHFNFGAVPEEASSEEISMLDSGIVLE